MLAYAELFGILGGLLVLFAFVPYIRSILKRKTVPNVVTWWVWTFATGVLVVVYLQSSEPSGWTIFLPIVYFFGQGIVALLSLTYGVKEWTRFDVICLIGGVLSIGLWYVFHSPIPALIANIAGDFFGALPTIRKTYAHPESEDAVAWTLGSLGALATLLAIENVSLFVVIFPLYMFLASGLTAVLALRTYLRPQRHV